MLKKGIALISLVIAIIIMIIISGVIVIKSNSSIEVVDKNMFAIEILNIQTAVDNYYASYGDYPVEEDQIEFDVTDVPQEDKTNQFYDETITANKIILYRVSLSAIGISDTEYGNLLKDNELDVYALSRETGKVYYLKGMTYKNKTYYMALDELCSAYFSSIGQVTSRDIKVYDVIFTPDTTQYTREGVSVRVKIPIQAEVVSLTATTMTEPSQNLNIENGIDNGVHKVMEVNSVEPHIAENYTITVNYTYNGLSKTAEYKVKNVDLVPPTISANIVPVVTDSTNLRVTLTVTDGDSNVDCVKYADSNITDINYFKSYGKTVIDNVFLATTEKEYTVYAKDYAGNECLLHISNGHL